MDFKSVFSHVGTMLEILGILSLVPIFVSWAFGENVYIPFFVTAVISFGLGSVLDKRFQKSDLDLGSAMGVASISFILISVIGAIPYLAYATPIDAIFESTSGFTTTSLSVFQPESLPYSLVFWRAFTQWIGGIGILLIFLLLVGSPGTASYYLYKAEAKEERIEASVQHTVKKTFKIYGLYTIIGIILLYAVGMPIFDSVANTFSAISTGGFSPMNDSIAGYNNPAAEFVIVLLMIVGATSFFIHNKLLRRELMYYTRNLETRIFWALIAIFAILLSVSFLGLDQPFRHGLFFAFSALTTTGFTTTTQLPGVSQLLIIILMIIGGYAGSTAGGLKLIRFGVIGKSFTWLGKKISYPQEAVVPFKIKNKLFKDYELTIISLFVSVYVVILITSAVIISFLGYSPFDAFFEVTSAQGNVGISVIPLADMHWVGKFVLIVNMLLGRLEIFPFLVLIYAIYRKQIKHTHF
ncbi:MAG: TrkH family potassium uptake protein [Candidatus Aenigmatarchaeota archaeon]|nr:TrkH family potassium uptake protein [Nanoarchaeota archaeon]